MRYQIEGFEVEVVYKKIKGIYLRVDPEDGTVRLHVPNGTIQEQITQVIHDHRTWIASRKKRPPATEAQKEAMRERLKPDSLLGADSEAQSLPVYAAEHA